MAHILPKAICHVLGTHNSPVGKPTWREATWRGTNLPSPPCEPCEWATLEVDPPAPFKPEDDPSLSGFESPSWDHRCHGADTSHPCCALSEFLTHTNQKTICNFCFKILAFGVICYITIDNYNSICVCKNNIFLKPKKIIIQNSGYWLPLLGRQKARIQ